MLKRPQRWNDWKQRLSGWDDPEPAPPEMAVSKPMSPGGVEVEGAMAAAPPKGTRDLTTGSVPKVLIAFALPTLGVNMLQSINGSVNAVWIGRLIGEEALAATSNATMVMFLTFAALFGLSMATTIMIAQAAGAGKIERAREVMGNSVALFCIAGIAIAALGWIFAPELLQLLATPEGAYPLALAYLRVIFLGMPFSFLMILLSSALRGVGDSVTPLRITLVNVFIDAGLNPILISGWGPFPEMGIRGSALATLLAGLVSVTALVARIYMKDLPIRLRGPDWRFLLPKPATLGTIVKLGIPMSFSMFVMSASSLVMIGLINREGVDTVAAYGVLIQIWNYVQMPAFAVGSAVSAMAAQNIGAGKWNRVGEIAWSGSFVNIVMTAVLVLIITLAIEPLLLLFLPNGGAPVRIAEHINLIVSWSYVAMGVSMVLSSVVRANGAVVVPFLILAISSIGVRFGIGFGFHDAYGANAIWAAFVAGSLAALVLQVAYYRWGNWREKKVA